MVINLDEGLYMFAHRCVWALVLKVHRGCADAPGKDLFCQSRLSARWAGSKLVHHLAHSQQLWKKMI